MDPRDTQQIERAIRDYRGRDFREPRQGTAFFELWGVGNRPDRTEKPFERFEYYKQLLSRMWIESSTKFQDIHKGTPFFFLAWTAFDLGDYDRALFFLDAAISEDARVDSDGWQGAPAYRAMRLERQGRHAAARIIPELRNRIDNQIHRFSGISEFPHRSPTGVDDLVRRFVIPMLSAPDSSKRNVVSALYAWIFEFEDHYVKLVLRGSIQTSVLPVLFHLFRGGLIFETLLKEHYQGHLTLGRIFNSPGFQVDFPNVAVTTGAASWEDIHRSLVGNSLVTAFCVTSQLRNFIGHDLARIDGFGDPVRYRDFFEQEVNAILYLISVKHP